MKLPYHNLRLNHWNPGAENPLILPVHVICNTSDESLHSNIRENSSDPSRVWMTMAEAHSVIAILCGGGPSLADGLEEIRRMQAAGGVVFALNGAASYLNANGIKPDYQVLIDAREETAQLIGPASYHLFASQVHPECFRRVPDAWLWHLQIEGIDDDLPERDEDLMMVGGAASVGNTATCLAYAMGYRTLHCFGYDSSHRGEFGHAYAQPMNDGDPCALVDFNGKTYKASLTMKLQAERFQDTARELEGLGCEINVHGDGLLPDLWHNRHFPLHDDLAETERAKYQAMWGIPSYRNLAPGEHHAERAAIELDMRAGDTVLDFGIGTGRGAAKLQALGYDVTGIDITDNSLDEGVRVPVIQACLWDMPEVSAKHGFCTDVMEHIPPEKVDAVLAGIRERTEGCYFNISTQPDAMGVLIGQPLHLTVKPVGWWADQLRKHWALVYVEDVGGEVVAVCKP